MSEYENIRYEVSEGIATITLDRPDRLNAFTRAMGREINAAFDTADADDNVRVVILTGAGRGFCAGADLGSADTFAEQNAELTRQHDLGMIDGAPRDSGGYTSLRIAASLKPVIAAINGPAVGIGVTMTLPADIRLASESAKLGFVFARRGLVPEAASSWFLPRLVGMSQAMEWVATGRVFKADEALAGRLVSRVVPDADLLPTARKIAREIVDNASGAAVAVARHMMWSMLGASTPYEAHRADSKAIFRLRQGPDAAEGVSAFLEKRAPKFVARIGDYDDVMPKWPAPTGDLS
ncbi:enoyl-CoA hydratase-related protein [Streptomyces sp. NPDC102279]|uniref:enoyl-CoA hydratase-related protein n=1 Tax=Streptomyces sp. NPDC102279 TaxID=3366153 RepID=UPI0038070708